jgi:hypothetical protein
MAEYNFCLSDVEYKSFVEKLFEQKFLLVPLAYYKTASFFLIKDQNEFDNFYKNELSDRNFFANQFFIIHPSYLDDKFYLSSLKMNQKFLYTIDRVGGSQYIELNLGENREEGKKIRLVPSMIGYQKLFWNKDLTVSRKPGQELITAYKEIKNMVARITRPVKILKSTVRISKRLIDELKDKNQKVCLYDEEINFN